MTNIVLDRPLTTDEALALRPALLAFREHSSYNWYNEGDIDAIIRHPRDYSGTSSALLGSDVAEFLTEFQTYARAHNEQVQEWLGTAAEPFTRPDLTPAESEPTDRTGLARAMMTARRRETEANESLTRRNEQVAALQAELAEVRTLHANQSASIMEMQAENRRLAANGVRPEPGRNWWDLGFRSEADYTEFCVTAGTAATNQGKCEDYDDLASEIGLLSRQDLSEEKEVSLNMILTITVPLGQDLSDVDEGDYEEAVQNWVNNNTIRHAVEEV